MKRSEINQALKDAQRCFQAAHWALPPKPRWDVTDCGLGRFDEVGLVLVNLAEQPEYCEKLMYAKHHQVTPMHTHRQKKEDIICRVRPARHRALEGASETDAQGRGLFASPQR